MLCAIGKVYVEEGIVKVKHNQNKVKGKITDMRSKTINNLCYQYTGPNVKPD